MAQRPSRLLGLPETRSLIPDRAEGYPDYLQPANVRHELEKIINYLIYLDIDLTNAFHQILLDPGTPEKLSVQTPWGQFHGDSASFVLCQKVLGRVARYCRRRKRRSIPDVTKTTFYWDQNTWKQDYRLVWENFKLGLQQSCELFYPDCSLEWILRNDVSDFGVGGMLIQLFIRVVEQQVIAKKLSPTALKWLTIQKEGNDIFYCHFLIETDHNNLLWMDASEVSMIVRWCIYLQSFDFKIRYIKGKDNTVADDLSRLVMLAKVYDELDHPEAQHSWTRECAHT
jgi:hypothetical protein